MVLQDIGPLGPLPKKEQTEEDAQRKKETYNHNIQSQTISKQRIYDFFPTPLLVKAYK